jgi:hypothetical protein
MNVVQIWEIQTDMLQMFFWNGENDEHRGSFGFVLSRTPKQVNENSLNRSQINFLNLHSLHGYKDLKLPCCVI